MFRRLGAKPEARAAYLKALELTENQIERLFLNDQLVSLLNGGDQKD